MNRTDILTTSPIRTAPHKAIVATLAAFFLLLAALAQPHPARAFDPCLSEPNTCGIALGRYGQHQVFDCQRSPAFPEAGVEITLSSFGGPLRDDMTEYSIDDGYVEVFVLDSTAPCSSGKVGLRFVPHGNVASAEIISPSGSIHGLDDSGFLYTSDNLGVGTYFANDTVHARGDSITFVAARGLVEDCESLIRYEATMTPLHPCGDPTGDDNVTATDALVALSAAVGSALCDLCQCDTDRSGSNTATDALTILRAAVGLGDPLACFVCEPETCAGTAEHALTEP
jgi:hypothetical protein